MPSFGKFLALTIFSLLISISLFATRPVSAQETYFFHDEFDLNRPGGQLDSDKWTVYENRPAGCIGDLIKETGGFVSLIQCASPQFPYIFSKNDPFPEGNFSTVIKFQYTRVTNWGTGIQIADRAPANGEGFTSLFAIGIWEDRSSGLNMRINFKDQSVYTTPINISPHELKIERIGSIYKLYFDNQLVFTSPSTNEKVHAIYLGNPSIQNPPVPSWTWFKVDFIRVVDNGPSEIIPEPFLDLPWDYGANSMTFNEAALAINAYFDHEYPLLSVGLNEPDKLLSFRGGLASAQLDYSSHDGYDYGRVAKATLGTPLLAPADGEATYMNSCGACGNAILIDHKNGYQTRYYHMQDEGLIVSTEGQKVNVVKGQQIGKVGYTGNVSPQGETGSHLHFMIIQDKNNDGNFEDNIPDGITDPFGWQSGEPDPWENYSFSYTGQQRTGNKSFYLFTKKLDNLNENLSANAKVFEVGKTKLEFPEGATDQNLNLTMKSEPNFADSILNSLGSILNIQAKDSAGNLVTTFLKNFSLTIDFSQFDLSRYNTDTLSIYSSQDGETWSQENTQIDLNNKTATTSLNHLTYFALMAERKDTIAPTTTANLQGLKGTGNNFRSDVSLSLTAQDNTGGLGVEFTAYSIGESEWKTYTSPLSFTDEGNYKVYFYSQDNDGNVEEIKSVEFSIDKTPPQINTSSPGDNSIYILNQSILADYSCSDEGGSGLQSCQGTVDNGGNINTQSVDEKTFSVEALDQAGNQTIEDTSYKVIYAGSGLCNGEAGHSILQPINPDGASIFKQGSTVPVKFRVCDNNGVSVSASDLVKSFNLIQSTSGTSATIVNEPVSATTPDSNFRFDPDKKQWIFNMNTKNLSARKTYFYKILLNDSTEIAFSFGLR